MKEIIRKMDEENENFVEQDDPFHHSFARYLMSKCSGLNLNWFLPNNGPKMTLKEKLMMSPWHKVKNCV